MTIQKEKHTKIIDLALNRLCEILIKVEVLDPIIKENQIRRFRKEWFHVLNSNLDAVEKINSSDFIYDCRYLFGRMNDENKIKENILKLTEETKTKLRLVE